MTTSLSKYLSESHVSVITSKHASLNSCWNRTWACNSSFLFRRDCMFDRMMEGRGIQERLFSESLLSSTTLISLPGLLGSPFPLDWSAEQSRLGKIRSEWGLLTRRLLHCRRKSMLYWLYVGLGNLFRVSTRWNTVYGKNKAVKSMFFCYFSRIDLSGHCIQWIKISKQTSKHKASRDMLPITAWACAFWGVKR